MMEGRGKKGRRAIAADEIHPRTSSACCNPQTADQMKDQGMAVLRTWPWFGGWRGDATECQLAFLHRLPKRVESQIAGSVSSLESSDEAVYYEVLLSLEETSVLVLQVNSNVFTEPLNC